LNFVEYGIPEGKLLIYFHGAPGSPKEAVVFDQYAKECGLKIICFDRFSAEASLQQQDYYQYLAKTIIDEAEGKPIDLVGFSIGCQAAIETSKYIKNQVQSLHLISAAAPLDGGDFLNNMAGKMVFSLAKKYPMAFKYLSYWQTLLAKVAPNILYKMLFSSAAGQDQSLSKTDEFKHYITPVLTHCFSKNVQGYIREVCLYVTPWKTEIINCTIKTHIWHGTHDNWSPVSMGHYLKKNMPLATQLELFPKLSHYSCLYAAAPKICALLGNQHSSSTTL